LWRSCQLLLLHAAIEAQRLPRGADIPLRKAVAGARVGLLEGRGFVVNPTAAELEASTLDLMVGGTADALLMIEGYCDFLSEEQMVQVCLISPSPSSHPLTYPGKPSTGLAQQSP
jgi:polyribonucleotide nucleotidyltransferase